MGYQYAWPSSLPLELEAQRLHAAPRAAAAHETAPAVVLARWPAFYDLVACGLAGGLVFPQAFFPGLSPALAVLAGLAVAALPLAVAPLGAWLGAAVSHRYGRGVGLTGGQFILGASTTAVAFVPTHQQLGWMAVALLVGCRLVQGVSVGAAWGDDSRRSGGWDLCAISAALGLLVAGGLFAVLALALSPADFQDWGWRYPFAVGFVINIVGLFANLLVLTSGGRTGADRPPLRPVT